MATHSVLVLAMWLSLCIGSVLADWNILTQLTWKTEVDLDAISRSSSSLKQYCESWRINVELNNIREFKVVPHECINQIKKYMTSDQYTADSQRAIEEVRLYLATCCYFKGDGKDAWIFDVDDTLLSTIPYFKKHSFGGEKLNTSSLEEWIKKSNAPALEHTLYLYQTIKNKGLKIFLVSSRSETLRSYTVDNLIDVGYNGWTGLHLRGLEHENMKVQQYKSQVREKLMNEGYRIWGIIGDQWSSIGGLPTAKRTFKLPNSMYYVA